MVYYQTKKWTSAKKCDYNNYTYDSKFEAQHAADLDLLVKAGEIKSYEKQVNLDLIVNGYLVCQYRIDFIVHHNDGTLEYVETKGYPTPTWRLKYKLFEALFSDLPNVKLSVVQQGSFRIPKARKIRKPL